MNTDRDYARAKALAHVQRAHELAFGGNILKKSLKKKWQKFYTEESREKRPTFSSDHIEGQSRLKRWWKMDDVFLMPDPHAFEMTEEQRSVFEADLDLNDKARAKQGDEYRQIQAQSSKETYGFWRDRLNFEVGLLEQFLGKHNYKKDGKDEKFYQILKQWKVIIKQQIETMNEVLSEKWDGSIKYDR